MKIKDYYSEHDFHYDDCATGVYCLKCELDDMDFYKDLDFQKYFSNKKFMKLHLWRFCKKAISAPNNLNYDEDSYVETWRKYNFSKKKEIIFCAKTYYLDNFLLFLVVKDYVNENKISCKGEKNGC